MNFDVVIKNEDAGIDYYLEIDVRQKSDGTLEIDSVWYEKLVVWCGKSGVEAVGYIDKVARTEITNWIQHRYERELNDAANTAWEKHKYDEKEWDAA